jgi:class 3 adenylate cyclase
MAARKKGPANRRSLSKRARTVPAKYIFLDIVGFTHNRSVEAQSEIVGVLNSIIKTSVKKIPKESLILLPTGDGVCIVFLNVDDPYDIHLQVALDILKSVADHTEKTLDSMRQFEVRVGVNANVDNLVIGVNGETNIAGAGINLAQRVMSAADGNQILVGQPVFETLIQREKYLNSFRSYTARIKHQIDLPVHQYVTAGRRGLSTDVPSQFRVDVLPKGRPNLTKLAAYYLAHAIANRQFLTKKIAHGQESYAALVLLYFLAIDSVGESEASDINPYKPHVAKASHPIEDQFRCYDTVDFWLCCDMSMHIAEKYLDDYADCFSDESMFGHHFVTQVGVARLRKEWPGIWDEFFGEQPNAKLGTSRGSPTGRSSGQPNIGKAG